MKIGIIDIGSNTIKAFVYEYDGNSFTTLDSRHYYSMLYSHVHNRRIKKEGLKIIESDVSSSYAFLVSNNCEKNFIIATSAVRDSDNKDEITKIIFEKTSLQTDILSDAEEAECDILSLMFKTKEDNLCGIDLGGGSGQIFVVQGNKIVEAESFPIGALRVKELFVCGDYPNTKEITTIKKYTESFLEKFDIYNFNTINVMGGSANSIKKLVKEIMKDDTITVQTLKYLLNILVQKNNIDFYLKNVVGERAPTIIPGIVILSAVAEVFSAYNITVHQIGVREGYLIKKLQTSAPLLVRKNNCDTIY